MGVTVGQLMVPNVIVARTRATVGEVRDLMLTHEVHALPVVDDAGQPAGIVTSSDLVADFDPGLVVAKVMTPTIYTVDKSAPAQVAARTMRNHRLHHLVVTDGNELVGIISAFDLLALIEDREFNMRRG